MLWWLLVLDVCVLILSVHAAFLLGTPAAAAVGPTLSRLGLVAVWLLALAWAGLYTQERRNQLAWPLVRSAKACFAATAACALALAFTQQPADSWRLLAWLLPTTLVAVGGVRLLGFAVARALLRRGHGRQRIAVVAWDDHSRRIAARLARHPAVEFAGFVAPVAVERHDAESFYPPVGLVDDLGKLIGRHDRQRVVCQDRFQRAAHLREVVNLCEDEGVTLELVPDPQGFIPRHIERRELAGMP